MRGLDDRLARIARRDELRERTSGTRPGTHRLDGTDPLPGLPDVSPVVDEVADALRAVVERNPGVFATVVVQEADTAWSVWIGEWDGTLRTRVTRLDPDPPAALPAPDLPAPTLAAVAEPDLGNEPTRPLAVPGAPLSLVPPATPLPSRTPLSVVPSLDAEPAPAPASAPAPAPAPVSASASALASAPAGDVTPLPRRRRRAVPAVSRALPAGPTRRPGEVPVTELLRPRRPLDDDISPDAATPPMGFRPVAAEAAIPLPGRSAPLDPGAPLPKRIPDSGIPLPRRRPGLPTDVVDDDPEPLPTRVPGRLSLAQPDGVGPLPPPEVPLAAAGPRSLPAGPATLPAPEDAIWPPLAPSRYRPAHQADQPVDRPIDGPIGRREAEPQPAEEPQGAETPALPVPTIPAPPLAAARVSGPAMNDRVAGRIADMLRREAKRDNRGMTS